MKEFIKSNQCLLYHVIIWSILIFIAMIEHRDYTFLIIMALFSFFQISILSSAFTLQNKRQK